MFSEMSAYNICALFWGPGSNILLQLREILTVSILEDKIPGYYNILHSPTPTCVEVKLLYLQKNPSRSSAIKGDNLQPQKWKVCK